MLKRSRYDRCFNRCPVRKRSGLQHQRFVVCPYLNSQAQKGGHESCSMNRPREHVGGLPGKCKKKKRQLFLLVEAPDMAEEPFPKRKLATEHENRADDLAKSKSVMDFFGQSLIHRNKSSRIAYLHHDFWPIIGRGEHRDLQGSSSTRWRCHLLDGALERNKMCLGN